MPIRSFILFARLNVCAYPFENFFCLFEWLRKPFKRLPRAFVCRSLSVYFCPFERLGVSVRFPVEGHISHVPTVLCKSNASEFRRISWLFLAFQRNFASIEISATFLRTFKASIVLLLGKFRMIGRSRR